jgi:hypothetical protein
VSPTVSMKFLQMVQCTTGMHHAFVPMNEIG